MGLSGSQILFFRMSITGVTSLIYTWKMHVEDSPLGKREVRGLLIIRAIGGFFGVFGLYCRLHLEICHNDSFSVRSDILTTSRLIGLPAYC